MQNETNWTYQNAKSSEMVNLMAHKVEHGN